MFDLRNKNIYVGNQEVLKGYLGSNLFYSSVGLVFPEPPTEYDTSYLDRAVFFGGGGEHTYGGSSITLEEDYSIEPNGLRLNGGKAFAHKGGQNYSGTVEMTIENSFKRMEPGDRQTILYLSDSYYFGGSHLSVIKKTDGVYLSMKSIELLVPDTDFIHISVEFFRSSYGYDYLHQMNININGSRWQSFEGVIELERPMYSIYATGDILVYDIKYYSLRNRNRTLNYNGIKDLPFVRTDHLFLMPEPDIVFPEPPAYDPDGIAYAILYGAGEENVYAGNHEGYLSKDVELKENGLWISGDRLYPTSSSGSIVSGAVDLTIENNFDHLESGDTEEILGTGLYASTASMRTEIVVERGSDGKLYVNMGDESTSGFGRIELSPSDTALHIHVAWRRTGSGPNYSFYLDMYINGELFSRYTASRSASSMSGSAISLMPGHNLLYDIKVYTSRTSEETALANYNGIKDSTFVRTNQL